MLHVLCVKIMLFDKHYPTNIFFIFEYKVVVVLYMEDILHPFSLKCTVKRERIVKKLFFHIKRLFVLDKQLIVVSAIEAFFSVGAGE